MPKPFHLAWFTNFTQGDWTNPVSTGTGHWDGKFFVEMAQAMGVPASTTSCWKIR